MVESSLEQSLRDLASLLSSVGEDLWSSWARDWAARIAAGGDPSGVRGAFAGMGSLDDLVIHPVNGHMVQDDQVAAVNRRLEQLRARIYSQLADV